MAASRLNFAPTSVEFAVFVSGVASMGLEILAGRLLAPEFGSSIYTWGSIIGVFLAALSVGYWLGGARAARKASRQGIALVLLGAALYVAALVLGDDVIVTATGSLPLPSRYASLVPITLLFGPPTALLGFVSPYAAELVEAEGRGDASGQVYALGTVGSIVGAFGTTFLLVPFVGVTGIEFAYGLLLVAGAAAIADGQDASAWGGAIFVAVVLTAAFTLTVLGPTVGGSTVYHTQTAYQELRVVDDDGIRTLYLDGTPHSAMDLREPNRYVFEYTRYFHMPLLFRDSPEVDRVLFVGGGGFSGPKRYAREYEATVDVVELDPEVTRVARKYFRVENGSQVRVHEADGRVFLQETDHEYDVIVLDAYRSDRVPHHLATVEFMRLAESRLGEDGVLLANVISARSGSGSALYRAEYRTIDRVFPQVYSFPTSDTPALQNIEVVATKNEELLTEADLERRNRERAIGIDLSGEVRTYRANVSVGDAPLLTDNHAPVDRLLESQVGRQYVIENSDGNATVSP